MIFSSLVGCFSVPTVLGKAQVPGTDDKKSVQQYLAICSASISGGFGNWS